MFSIDIGRSHWAGFLEQHKGVWAPKIQCRGRFVHARSILKCCSGRSGGRSSDGHDRVVVNKDFTHRDDHQLQLMTEGQNMRATGMRLIAGTCLVLSVGVLINVLFLQGGENASRGVAAPNGQRPHQQKIIRHSKLSRPGAVSDERPQLRPQPPRQLIRAIQRELGARKYFNGRPDGRLNIVTRAAIMAYELDYGQTLTGEASEALLHSILLGAALQGDDGQGQVGPEAKAVIQHVQSLLTRAGFHDVVRSGKVDAATKRAIMTFERRFLMEPKGRISAELVQRLVAETRRS